jgi:hypothetical protein
MSQIRDDFLARVTNMAPHRKEAMEENLLRFDEGVRCKRSELLEKVKENRSEHRKVFEDALAGWEDAVVKRLATMVKNAKDKKKFELQVGLPQPQDHTNDYDRVIAMLELSVDETVVIDHRQFAQYYMDDWGWKNDFITTASTYTSM